MTTISHSISQTLTNRRIDQMKFSLTYTTDPVGGYGLIIGAPNYVKVYLNDVEIFKENYDPVNARDNDYYANILNNYVTDIIPVKITLEVFFTAQYGRTGAQTMETTLTIVTTGMLR